VDTSHYTEYRPLMFSIAYRMTGSVSDAEDIVQEAFLRASKDVDVASPKAYLATVTTRLAIDHLRSARVRRESYVGTWLPEPLIGNGFGGFRDGSDPAELAETSDSLSMAFLVLLESLAPAERAVFLSPLTSPMARCRRVRSAINPDKLHHLGPVSEVALRRVPLGRPPG
jgi:RNA polymerase sigma factor (sigma-70 family)